LPTKQKKACTAIALVKGQREIMPRIGSLKLYHILSPQLKEIKVGRDKLNIILKVNGLLVPPLRQYRKTTNSNHTFKKHKDLVSGLEIVRPEQVWVSDITYIYGHDRHYYLSLITDAYSKRVMGYSLDVNMNVELVINSLKMALQNRKYRSKLIHHSDRGSQYCCKEYQEILRRMGVKTSMTENYDPYANAIAERVNGILKQEYGLEEKHCSFIELKTIVDQTINIYNFVRPHLSCYMLTPVKMHLQNLLPIKKYNSKSTQRIKINV